MGPREVCLEENELLDLVTGTMPPERAAEADAHIDGCRSCRLVLTELARIFELRASVLPEEDDPAPEESHDAESLPNLLPPALLRGSQIGRYMVLEPLGAGAMGVVYAAYDPQLDRKVALKLLRSHKVGTEHGERLLREARAIAKLAHPNVVVVHDVGLHEGALFMAMEFVEGGTLGEWQQDREHDDILDAYVDAARGLAAVHRAGLVHHDFKPANVLIGTDGRARVTDFGLARLGEASEQETMPPVDLGFSNELLTKTGTIVGTPAYMSPEQFEGEVADARSDQFSFCVALYEALCGERPFRGGSYAELEIAVARGEVASSAGFEGLPRGLRAALSRGLQVDPAARFESMEDLLAALVPAFKTRRWVPAVVGGFVALGVGMFGFTMGSNQVEATPCQDDLDAFSQLWTPTRKRALRDEFMASDVAYAPDVTIEVEARLDGYAQQWEEHFVPACASSAASSETTCLRARSRDLENLLAALERGGPDVVEFAVHAVQSLVSPSACEAGSSVWVPTPVPPATVAEDAEAVREDLSMAEALFQTRQFEEALDAASLAHTAAAELDYPPVVAEANLLLGRIYVDLDRVEDAQAALVASARDAWSSGHERIALQAATELVHVAGIYADEPAAGRVWAELGEATLERTGGSDLLEGTLAEARGALAHHTGDFMRAVEELKQAFELRSQALPPDDLTLGYTHARLAVALQERGELVEGLEHAQRALEIHREALGPRHPDVAMEMAAVAATLMFLGRDDEAEPLLRTSIELRERGHRYVESVVSDRAKLATLLTRQKRFDEAEALLETALAHGHEHDLSARSRSVLHHTQANNAFMAGRDDEAIAAFGRAIEVLEGVEGAENDLAHALVSRSVALLTAQRCDEATPQLLRALEILEGPVGTEYERVYAQTYYAYGLLCAGRTREAADVASAAYAVAAADPDMLTKRETLAEVLSDALYELGEREASETAARQALADALTPMEEAAASFRIARATVSIDREGAVDLAKAALPKAPARDREAIETFLAKYDARQQP